MGTIVRSFGKAFESLRGIIHRIDADWSEWSSDHRHQSLACDRQAIGQRHDNIVSKDSLPATAFAVDIV
jgi:hypothetical protein